MIAVVDYATGNLRSVADALRRAGAEFTLTADPALLRGADKVILPGVGEASSAMSQLRERGLDTVIPSLTQPVLGICIGMQLMCLSSEEGDARCMGIFPTQVLRLPATAADGGDNRYFTRLTEWNLKDNVFSTPFTVPFAWANRQVLCILRPLLRRRTLRRNHRHDRLRSPVQRGARERQLLRHAVPPRKKRCGGRADFTQFSKPLTP